MKNGSTCEELTVVSNPKHKRADSGATNSTIPTPMTKPNFENLKKECDRI